MPPLTDSAIRSLKPPEKACKLFDGGGLYLLVKPNGARLWRMKYRVDGREKLISFGQYPDVPLKSARERRDEARRLIAARVDPSAKRKAERAATSDTFEAIAREYLELKSKNLSARTFAKKLGRFEAFAFPFIGKLPITSIAAPQLLAALRRIEERGNHETAHRVRAECGEVFRYAIATGRAERDPTGDLRGALAPVVVRNHAAITEPMKIGQLVRAIYGYQGQPATEYALKLLPLVFVRPGELRAAEWSEFDLETAEWRIPGSRMKMREPHIVPLARQAVALLRDLQPLTAAGRYLFPSLRGGDRPISNNTLNASLRRLGYTGDEMVSHGFRSMASTCLNEQGWHPDLIELQLAHAERNKVRAAYNRATRLAERRKMMQAWADYLDALRTGAEVIAFRRATK
ncbi:tyrosine-type recombinase/integrase [Peristeroidobacter agariperforans]|uniref:tyrosine-type recombinase/integrase n=1 Tax=Peristeroidobacter agariperforans TaxID=268404 RepID=UPI00101BFFDD|nr:integrase arm-type DNA-binding domain-containing protein [Peristeroidobacter agariperforans]